MTRAIIRASASNETEAAAADSRERAELLVEF